MSSLSKVQSDVRRELRNPSERSLADGAYINDAAIDVCDELVTLATQTNEAWYLMSFTLDTESGRDEYSIESLAPSLGKLRFIYTKDDNDANHIRRPVDIVDFEQLQDYYKAGSPALSTYPTNVKHTAKAMATIFDANENVNKILIAPTPAQTAQYKIIYEPDVSRPSSMGATVFRFRQFDGYVTKKIALQVLQYCSWEDFEAISDPLIRERANNERRADIAKYLTPQVMQGDALYWKFRQSNSNQNEHRTLGFGYNRW